MPRAVALAVLALSLVAPAHAASAAAKPSAAELARRLSAIDGRIRSAGIAYDRARWRLADTDVRVRRIDDKLKSTASELARAERLLGRRVRAIYRNDRLVYLEILLQSTTVDEMVTRMDYIRRISEGDARAVGRVKALRRRLTRDRRRLSKERAARADDAEALRKRRDTIVASLRSQRAQYAQLKARLDAAMRREKTSGAVTYVTPRGPSGMLFPMAGPCYFSNTWGASRSGGRRRHHGTDIMAARGTPCVAVLSGTVRAKSSALGGLTIWLNADNGWSYYYAHLDRYAVTSGRVRAGQVIGYVGSTGNARGGAPHLHFEIHPAGGGAVNPYPYLRAAR